MAIRIGQDILEVAGYGEYFLNGVANADLTSTEANLSGFPIAHTMVNKKQHSFVIEAGAGNQLIVSTMKDIVSVKINPRGAYGP